MRSRRDGRAAFPFVFLPAVAALLLAASCAAPLHYAQPVDPMTILSRDALAYVRLARGPLSELAPAVLPPAELAALGPMLAKTAFADLALLPPGGGAAPDGAAKARFEAVLIGDYPWRSASLALGGDKSWRKSPGGKAWVSQERGLGLAFPGPSVLLAASLSPAPATPSPEGRIEGLVGRLLSPGPSVIPAQLAAMADRDIVLWAPEPFARLGSAFLGESLEVPALGVMITGSRAGSTGAPAEAGKTAAQEESVYEVSVVFLMKDGDEARVFRPALRLAWYGLSKALFPGEEGASALRFELSGTMVAAGGFRVKASSLAAALRAIAKAGR